MQDPDFGVVGYGCEVAEDDESYTIEPWDGVGARVAFMPLGVQVESVKGKIKRVSVSKEKDGIEVHFEKPYKNADSVAVTINGLNPGRYLIDDDEIELENGGSIEHGVEYNGRDSLTLSIRRKTE